MKDKDEVSNLLAKLTIKNDLDREEEEPEDTQEEEEEEVVKSVEVVDDNGDGDGDEYVSKGPVRGNHLQQQGRTNPYQMSSGGSHHLSKNAGGVSNLSSNVIPCRFIDDETELEFIMSRMELPSIKEETQAAATESRSEGNEHGIPDLPKLEKTATFKPVLLMQNLDADYQAQDLGLEIILDKTLRKLGIWIPETTLDQDLKVDKDAMQVEIYIQLTGPNKSRLVNCNAIIKKDHGSGKYVLIKQFVHLAPMVHAGMTDMISDIDPTEVEKAMNSVSGKNVTDLLKSYGPNNESILMTLCCLKNDLPSLRAQVFALLAFVLGECNQEGINMIIRKNQVGLSALDYATVANNAKIAAFLAKVFYIFGQDVLGRDSQGNSILHMMARKGDQVAPTLNTLISITYRDHNNNGKVYPTNVKNNRHEMPIHIVSMNKHCAQHIIHLLVKDCPVSLKSQTFDGSLPIHLACQYSSDPTLLASLLYYDKSIVSAPRTDGFTPLHLVAARADIQDAKLGLIRLSEETQLRMIKILLEYGADKKAKVEDLYRPFDLLSNDRSKAKVYLSLDQESKKVNPEAQPSFSMSPLSNESGYQYEACYAYSPAMSYQEGQAPSPASSYNIGSVASNHTGSDDSDSDNCSPQKMGTAAGLPENLENEDFDFIAKVLYNHPTIQAVMANNI